MLRKRVAIVLGVVAVLAVLGTAAVAVSTYRNDDDSAPEPEARVLTVADPATGASFEVPAQGWRIEDRSVRIYYADERERPIAVVRGPAVYRAGYCGRDSNQAFAGFTRQGLDAWTGGLGEPGPVDGKPVDLEDGTAATMLRVSVDVEALGRCGAPEVEVAMVEADDVRVVVVSDAGALPGETVERALLSLQLP